MVPRLALSLIAAVVSALGAAPANATPGQPAEPPAPSIHSQQDSPAGPLMRPGTAQIAARRDLLWATVNICDSDKFPDAMGIRASMPGNGRRQRMYMRFSSQWWSGLRQQWLDVHHGRSPWVYAGSARYLARQAGYTFQFLTPPAGRAYILRGTVEFQWRTRRKRKGARKARWTIARRRVLLTSTRAKGVDGASPKETAKAMCAIANLQLP
jgi:hypothetical protein